MPYFREGLCVYKELPGGGRKKKGCSKTIEAAEAYLAKLRMIEAEEKEMETEMDLKAVWSTASVNDLPDSSFLYIEPGGSKDSSGKTEPRSLRHLPYKDASGKVDLPHLKNAISRLGQPKTGSNWKHPLSASKRASLQKRAQGILSRNKELDPEDDEQEEKGFVPYGVTSFGELDALKSAQEVASKARETTWEFQDLTRNVLDEMAYPDPMDETPIGSRVDRAEGKIKQLASDMATRIKSFFTPSSTKETDDFEDKIEGHFMVWKSKSHEGRLAWAATYSNNFRDRDNPPEIISEQSHLQFEKAVDEGECPPPELWFWHVKEWKFGTSTWVGYDDSGFAIAGGLIDEGSEWFAKAISQIPLLVSHGMPVESIERDPKDKSIIIKHRSAEISPLPSDYAANTLTGWMLLKEENAMPVPIEKRQALINSGLIDPEKLDALEQSNKQREAKGINEELERKEAEEDTAAADLSADETEEVTTTTQPAPEQDNETEEKVPGNEVDETKESNPEQEIPFTLKDVADAMIDAVKPMADRIAALEQEVKSLKESDEQKITEQVKSLPPASASAYITRAIMSAINSEDTVVDGRTSLAKAQPQQTEAKEEAKPGTFSIPFIQEWVKEQSQPSQ